MIFEFLKQQKRRRLRARQFPQEWLKLIQRHVVFFHKLTAGDRAELLGHMQVFLAEFAHQLDYENHAADGVPGLATREQQSAWSEVMNSEFASLRAADESGIPTLLDTYGATDPVEFFAVSVEAFFEQPRALRARHPRLYAELQKYFQQDPVKYSAER